MTKEDYYSYCKICLRNKNINHCTAMRFRMKPCFAFITNLEEFKLRERERMAYLAKRGYDERHEYYEGRKATGND